MNIDLSKPDLNKPDNNKADSNNSNSNKPDSKPQLTEKYKVDMFIGLNAENFHPHDLMIIKDKLEKMNDDKFFLIQGVELQKPSTILLIAIILGWERFWLGDVALGILKIVTFYGCLIWWFIDIFSAKDRAKKYNFAKISQVLSMA
ncbi:MAG: TM2 domain-containing protein [Sediminibacterium sp.]|jgi:TM2 domain-containing membrane protein YozV